MRTRNALGDGGVPENTNPFVVNTDYCIGDGILENLAPQYFGNGSDGQTCAPVDVVSRAFSQREAETLVRDLYESDVLGGDSFAVKESFSHIVPRDLRDRIWISKNLGETCVAGEVYHLE